VLPAEVIAIHAAGDANADVRLLCGNSKFVSRITRASLARLSLEPGARIFAIVKSVTVDPLLGTGKHRV
jgi:molybdopterin-binding protein